MLSVYRNEIIFEECQYLLQGVLFLGAHLYGVEVFEKQGRVSNYQMGENINLYI